jgi:hypothetical protein
MKPSGPVCTKFPDVDQYIWTLTRRRVETILSRDEAADLQRRLRGDAQYSRGG